MVHVLRLIILVTAMALSSATLALRPAHAAVDVDGGGKRTARAVRAAMQKHQLDGDVWLGKLRGVGGRRDTLLYVSRELDAARTIDVIVYMEGNESFADAAMDHRHAASIARLRGSFVYVAPDSPSSAHGVPRSGNEHWEAGCADRVCPGGRAAPGDFLVFLDEVRSKIARMVGAKREALDLRVSLIGFSAGGKGVLAALTQLEQAKFEVGGLPVRIADVIFADGNYLDNALHGSWQVLAPRPEAPRLTILVETGEFIEKPLPCKWTEPCNRRRALAFWRAVAPDAPLPAPNRATSAMGGPPPEERQRGGGPDVRATAAPRLRLIPLEGGHHLIGDAAVDYLELRRAT